MIVCDKCGKYYRRKVSRTETAWNCSTYLTMGKAHCHTKQVPEDIALVSFDNLDISKNMTPSISSVRQPRLQLGYLSAEALFEKISDPSLPNKKTLLDTELIIRESSTLPGAC